MLLNHHTWGSDSDPIALFVHGAISDWSSWKRVGPWFAERGFHAIAVDQRGHGRSQVDASACDRTASTMASDLVETISRIRPGHDGVDLLIGHSIGSTVGLVCAAEHPSFVRRLVCEDGPAGPSTHDFAAIAAKVHAWIVAARVDPEALVQEWLVAPPEAFLSEDEIREKVAATAAADPQHVPEAIAAYPVPFDYAERCAVPALIMMGAQEHHGGAMVGDDLDRFMAALTCGTLVEFPHAGHAIHQPFFDEFTGCLAKWLGL